MKNKLEVVAMKNEGLTFQQIGLAFGISRQRAFQIFHNLLGGVDKNREFARERDNHTCQICGKKWHGGRKFDVHHKNGLCGKVCFSRDKLSDLNKMITGKVKWFSGEKGFGFIQADKKDYFVHFQEIKVPGFKTLESGANVSFTPSKTSKGLVATNVVLE